MSGYDPLLTVAIPGSDAVYSSSTTGGETINMVRVIRAQAY